MLPLDLRPFGIDATLNNTTNKSHFSAYRMYSARHEANGAGQIQRIKMNGIWHRVLEKLGKGTYGVTYKVSDPSGKEMAIKITKKLDTTEDVHNFLTECILQIVLAEASKGEVDGPYVPTVFFVGLGAHNQYGYICSELMRNTLDNLLAVSSRDENSIIIPDALKQISKILMFFSNKLKFNHRDLKADNVMYVRNGARRVFKLIDFGFSCLTIPRMGAPPLEINGTIYFDSTSECFKVDRDMSQLIYQIVLDNKRRMRSALYKRLSDMLVANVQRHTCRMGDGCPRNKMETWRNTYNFLDRPNVSVPFGEPARVTEQMELFGRGLPFDRAILKVKKAKAKECPPGTALNPATNRCVKIGGPAWRSFNPTAAVAVVPVVVGDPPCKPDQERNPATRRCIKKCPEGTRRVEGTRRCVKKLKPASTEVV